MLNVFQLFNFFGHNRSAKFIYSLLFLVRFIAALVLTIGGLITTRIIMQPDSFFAAINHDPRVIIVMLLILAASLGFCLIFFWFYEYKISNREGMITIINNHLLAEKQIFRNNPLYHNKIQRISAYQKIDLTLPANTMNQHLPFQKMNLSLVVKIEIPTLNSNEPIYLSGKKNIQDQIKETILNQIKTEYGNMYGPKNLAQLNTGKKFENIGSLKISWPHDFIILNCQSNFKRI